MSRTRQGSNNQFVIEKQKDRTEIKKLSVSSLKVKIKIKLSVGKEQGVREGTPVSRVLVRVGRFGLWKTLGRLSWRPVVALVALGGLIPHGIRMIATTPSTSFTTDIQIGRKNFSSPHEDKSSELSWIESHNQKQELQIIFQGHKPSKLHTVGMCTGFLTSQLLIAFKPCHNSLVSFTRHLLYASCPHKRSIYKNNKLATCIAIKMPFPAKNVAEH
eukprot:bmy_20008T0